MKIKRQRVFCIFSLVFLFCSFPLKGHSADTPEKTTSQQNGQINLSEAYICEDVREGKPQNRAVAFSISLGKVSCYTSFDRIPDETYVSHVWYFNDNLHKKAKLYLTPPRWATYSEIYFREGDKGPWRVDIRDSEGKLLQILRFSIVD